MQKTYNTINQNRLRIKESLSKNVKRSKPIFAIESQAQEWFAKLEVINKKIINTLQNRLAPLLNQSYKSEEEADGKLANAFWLFGKECDKLMELYDEIRSYYAEEFSSEEEILSAFASICSTMLKELLLLHINIEDALKNSPEDAKIEYNPDVRTQIEFIQQQLSSQPQATNDTNWFFPLVAAFGLGFMLGGE